MGDMADFMLENMQFPFDNGGIFDDFNSEFNADYGLPVSATYSKKSYDKILHETEKATLFRTRNGRKFWIPNSQMEDHDKERKTFMLNDRFKPKNIGKGSKALRKTLMMKYREGGVCSKNKIKALREGLSKTNKYF